MELKTLGDRDLANLGCLELFLESLKGRHAFGVSVERLLTAVVSYPIARRHTDDVRALLTGVTFIVGDVTAKVFLSASCFPTTTTV
jgi:hypothetical protein